MCLVSLVFLARGVSPLPLCALLSALTCLPLLHDDFDPLLKARYTMPVVPLAYAAVGALVAGLGAGASRRRFPIARIVTGIGLWAVLAAGFLASLSSFEAESAARGCDNSPQRAFVAAMEQHRQPGEWVLLNQGVVRPAERLGYLQLLEWSGRKVGSTRLIRRGVWDELRERPTFLTVVNQGQASAVFERQGIPIIISPAAASPPASEPSALPADGVGLYRVTAHGATLLADRPSASCEVTGRPAA